MKTELDKIYYVNKPKISALRTTLKSYQDAVRFPSLGVEGV